MNKEQAKAALRSALKKIASGFVESLKTDNMENALGAAQGGSKSRRPENRLLAWRRGRAYIPL